MNHPSIAGILIGALALGASARAASATAKDERTWMAKCASCHGDDGTGQTTKGRAMHVADMSTASWQRGITDPRIKQTIEDGIDRMKTVSGSPAALHGPKISSSAANNSPTVQVKQQMDAYKEKLKPEQIDGLVACVRGLAKGT
jgi:mono/diheme cytochrome c family protein